MLSGWRLPACVCTSRYNWPCIVHLQNGVENKNPFYAWNNDRYITHESDCSKTRGRSYTKWAWETFMFYEMYPWYVSPTPPHILKISKFFCIIIYHAISMYLHDCFCYLHAFGLTVITEIPVGGDMRAWNTVYLNRLYTILVLR